RLLRVGGPRSHALLHDHVGAGGGSVRASGDLPLGGQLPASHGPQHRGQPGRGRSGSEAGGAHRAGPGAGAGARPVPTRGKGPGHGGAAMTPDEQPEGGPAPGGKGFKARKREDHALVLIRELLASLGNPTQARRLLLELSRYYDPILGGAIVDV